MNNEIVLSDIDGYPDIIDRIVDISEVVTIRLQGVDNYGITITMDNNKCINVFKTIKGDDGHDAYQDMCDLKESLLRAAQQTHQNLSSHIVHSSKRDDTKTKIERRSR